MSEYIVDYELIPLKWRDGYGLSDIDLTEEIVRCRDCKHSCDERRDTSIGWITVLVCCCEQWSTAGMMPSHKVKPEGFCAWAEGKNGEENNGYQGSSDDRSHASY